jgi:uroporphyrin-III C-methyltransferase
MHSSGSVVLVGAGPGAADLITLRGLRHLRDADVVVYDRLIDPSLLEEAPGHAERIYVGKGARFAALDQRAIESTLIDRARAGQRVVRLKGGDPFVFGRGGEEVEALAAAGIPYEVVPGITSAVAAPAAAGIPLTHRGLASSFTVITGHEDPGKPTPAVDWTALGTAGTLVILMGLERLPDITARLLAAGLSAATPAAVISSGTLPQQQTVTGTLATIASLTARESIPSPATIVIGDVVRFAEVVDRHTLAEAV